jgi:hypothetical protein
MEGLTIHAVVDTNGLPIHLALTLGEAHDRLCSVLLSAFRTDARRIASHVGNNNRLAYSSWDKNGLGNLGICQGR